MLSRLYRGAQELSETLDLGKLAQLAVRHSVEEFGVKSAFFLALKDNKEWEVLSAFLPLSPPPLLLLPPPLLSPG